MTTPVFAVLVAKNKTSMLALANKGGWKILPNTGFDFPKLESDDDHAVQFVAGMDAIAVNGPGCVALAYQYK